MAWRNRALGDVNKAGMLETTNATGIDNGQTFAVTPSAFQTLILNPSFANLSSVEFDGLQPIGLNSPEFQLDNITYTPATTPTREPASIAFLATILLGIAVATVGRRFLRRALL
jgi:hypothetical protein